MLCEKTHKQPLMWHENTFKNQFRFSPYPYLSHPSCLFRVSWATSGLFSNFCATC